MCGGSTLTPNQREPNIVDWAATNERQPDFDEGLARLALRMQRVGICSSFSREKLEEFAR
jgi:hypothetical protein